MSALGRLRAFVERRPTHDERQRFARVLTAQTRAYPEQWALGRTCVEGPDPLVVVEANRRAGKTQGIGTAILERLVTQNNYKAIQVTHNLDAPTTQWWDRKGATSALDLLGSWATHAHVHRAGLGAIKSITFPWGSQLTIIVIQTVGDVDKLRGLTADIYWADEAQDISALPAALTSGIFPTLADSGGRVILSGTPGLDPESYYGRAVRGAQSEEISSSWVAASVWSWENPVFGTSASERWQTIVDRTLRPAADSYRIDPATLETLANLTPEELPQLREATDGPLKELCDSLDDRVKREYFGLWSGSSAPAVFRAWPSVRYWARENDLFGRELELVGPDIAERLRALPRPADARAWTAVVTADMGYDPDPVAIGVLVSHPGTAEKKYELCSEVHRRMPDGDAFERLATVVSELQTAGVKVAHVVADLSGDRAGTRAEWDRTLVRRVRARVPVVAPRKADKAGSTRAMNLDVEAGRLIVIQGSPLDVEGRYLRYRPIKDPGQDTHLPKIWKRREVVLPDGRHERPGDHCLDGARYGLPFLDIASATALPPVPARGSWTPRPGKRRKPPF